MLERNDFSSVVRTSTNLQTCQTVNVICWYLSSSVRQPPLFIKPDQLDPWIKDQLKNDSTVYNFAS